MTDDGTLTDTDRITHNQIQTQALTAKKEGEDTERETRPELKL